MNQFIFQIQYLKTHQENVKHQNLDDFHFTNESNSLKIKDQQQTINFQLILQQWKSERCYAFDIDKQLSLIVIGLNNGFIQLLKFQSNNLKVQKVVKGHKYVLCIVVIKNSNQFISSGDQIIKIWSFQGNYLRQLQQLSGHSRPIRCLLISQNEDLIVSGGYDKKIKFWIRNDNSCKFDQELLEHENFICGISLNEQQNQLISTAWEEPIIKISQQQPCKTWVVVQTVELDLWGIRVCFLNDQMFSFQPYNGQSMHLYKFQSQNNVYTLNKTIDVKSSEEGCTNLFPSQFIKQKSILINKNGECVIAKLVVFKKQRYQLRFQKQIFSEIIIRDYNLFKRYKNIFVLFHCNIIQIGNNSECILIQQLQFGHYCINGSMSHDGQYLITWDLSSNQIQIRQNLNF